MKKINYFRWALAGLISLGLALVSRACCSGWFRDCVIYIAITLIVYKILGIIKK